MACGRSQTSFVLKSRSESSRNAIATVNFYSLQVQPGHKRTRTRNKYLHLLQKSTAQFSDMRAQVAAGLLFLFSCNGMDNFPDSSRAIREVADRTTEIPTPQRRHHPNARYQLTSNPNGLISGQPNTQGSHGDRVMFTPSRYGRADSAWPSKLGEHERVDMSGGRSQNPSTEKNVAEVASESVGKNDLAPRRKVRKESSTAYTIRAVWILLEFWFESRRNGFYREIKVHDFNFFTPRNFFNTIFSHSILNLTTRLIEHERKT
ncbi:hypothetical protein MJO29_000966 [Puccinia striiformis f. sp. tritici]|nr:hypothetical protein MJO29_000966 [Puccinia striiformis f. sp. tritici]